MLDDSSIRLIPAAHHVMQGVAAPNLHFGGGSTLMLTNAVHGPERSLLNCELIPFYLLIASVGGLTY